MRTVMLGYWVILVGIVLDILGTIWDATTCSAKKRLGGCSLPKGSNFWE